MSVRNLEYLFRPRSIAVFGASNTPSSVGSVLMRNLLDAGFEYPIMPVNPKYEAVAGVIAYPNASSLPKVPDLAVICTPPAAVPGLVAELGEMGTRAAVVLTAGMSAAGDGGISLERKMIEAARPHLLRILGPNCVGLIIPGLGMNASFAHASALPGELALITQSGALVTAILDWANSKGIGFSHFVSLGNSADVDFGDSLDYLGSDPGTRAILLYIESIKHARKFMSAARAAARNKPVIVVKAGRAPEAAKAATSHTGALAGSDDVFDSAIRRAGMLRVPGIEELFDAVETLARAKPIKGDRLTILTNGGGPGVLATDVLVLAGGRLAELPKETISRLDAILPSTWSRANPVDIIGDAPAQRYVESFEVLAKNPQSDAVLFIHAPSAIVPSDKIAEALAPIVAGSEKCVLACWLGSKGVAKARSIFAEHGIPTYDTPEDAVGAFMQLVNYRKNQDLLMETPPSLRSESAQAREKVGRIVSEAIENGRKLLTEPEAKAILSAYDIPVVDTRTASNEKDALEKADEIGFPVAVKLLSREITHKSDVGGVALDLDSRSAVKDAIESMLKRVADLRPGARIDGFAVQTMARRPGAFELIVGAATDPIFGPVILFGHGGTAVEVIGDRAVALPPLNQRLAKEMVSRTRVSKLLAGFRNRPAANFDAIYHALIQVSRLVSDVPQIEELDINPLLADDSGVIALDARIKIASTKRSGIERLAIRPYPRELEEIKELRGRKVMIRPIRPEDAPAHRILFQKLSAQDIRDRFFVVLHEISHSELARYTQIDYEREMAFIATSEIENGESETLGVVRIVADPDNVRAVFAITVRSDLKGQGLGRMLADKMIRYARDRGIKTLYGEVLGDNRPMLALAEKLGFEKVIRSDSDVLELRLDIGKI